MTRFLVVAAMASLPSAVLASAPPFTPLPNVPDYVATVVVRHAKDGKIAETRTVTHRAGWTRVDAIDEDLRSWTTYFNPANARTVTVVRQASGEYGLVTFRRRPRADVNALRTGANETFLGESCEVWNVLSDGENRFGDRKAMKLSCVSGDGIVLWAKLYDKDEPTALVETTAIARRPVGPGEVRPPDDLLDLRHWTALAERIAPSAPAPMPLSDYEAVLATAAQTPDGKARLVRTTRRHRLWTAVESLQGDGRRHVWSYDEKTKLSISFENNAAGDAATLTINVPLRAESDADREALQRATQAGGKDIVAGEECWWSSLSSNSGDMVFAQCKTGDGIVLKEKPRWGARGLELEAIRLQRRQLELADVVPPAEVFRRETWGLPP